MTRSLTDRNLRILVFVADSLHRNGYAPSYREIQRAAKLHSISGVAYQLDRLEARGFIHRGKSGTARTIGLTDDGAALVVEIAKAMQRHPAGNRRVAS